MKQFVLLVLQPLAMLGIGKRIMDMLPVEHETAKRQVRHRSALLSLCRVTKGIRQRQCVTRIAHRQRREDWMLIARRDHASDEAPEAIVMRLNIELVGAEASVVIAGYVGLE
jgi:hypothetical protein